MAILDPVDVTSVYKAVGEVHNLLEIWVVPVATQKYQGIQKQRKEVRAWVKEREKQGRGWLAGSEKLSRKRNSPQH